MSVPRDIAEAIGRAVIEGTASCRGVGIKARACRGGGRSGVQIRVDGRWNEPRDAADELGRRPREVSGG